MLNCRECLCILTIKPLLVIFANVFSHSVCYLFTVLTVSFDALVIFFEISNLVILLYVS